MHKKVVIFGKRNATWFDKNYIDYRDEKGFTRNNPVCNVIDNDYQNSNLFPFATFSKESNRGRTILQKS